MDYDVVAGVGPNRVLVVGAGKTGLAVARFCMLRGAKVTITDRRSHDELAAAKAELGERVSWEAGGHRAQSFVESDLIVVSPGVPDLPELQAARKKGVRIVGEIELASRFIRAPIVGVTGTNGKSTVTALCGEIAKQTGRPVFVGGNLGTPLITCVDTPAATEKGIVVVELSSFQLETCDTFHPRAATILNVTPDHLDRYATMDDYAAAKARIAQRMTHGDVFVYNHDDRYSDAIAARLYSHGQVPHIEGFSLRGPMQFGGGVDGDELLLMLDAPPRTERFPVAASNLIGRHNVANVLAALLLMRGSSLVTYEQALAGLRAFHALPHRMQLVGEKRGHKFYDDSKATNVDSVVAGLDGFPTPFVLIAGGRDKGAPYAQMVQAMQKSGCRAAILIGEAADKIASAIGDTIPIARAQSMQQAIEFAVEKSQAGDAIVLSPACSSYDMFDNYEHRGRVFKECVEAL